MGENDESKSNDESQKEADARHKIEKEGKELLDNVLSGNINTQKDKVGYILNRYYDTRNSDVELAWQYWITFEKDKFNGSAITKNQMFILTRISSLVRSRAKIQNEYKLFQADDVVKQFRGVLEGEKRNESIEDKPSGLPGYTVFIDETGKTQDYLCVGSLWIVEGGLDSLYVKREIDEWKLKNSIEYEFHFTELTKHKLQSFKDFFIKFIALNSTAGFKLIAVRNSGFKELSQPITDLTFHLLNNGVQHENETKRAPLPRTLQVWLDEDEKGSDILKLENLRERIIAQKIQGLYLDNFHAVSSKSNYFIQAVDLFTASVNRKINIAPVNTNHKDELADFILQITNFNIAEIDSENDQVDNSIVFNLSDFNFRGPSQTA
jgi:hypothetical protein